MTAEELRYIGEKFIGERWQSPLARVLGLSPRNIRRYVANEYQIPASVEQQLCMLCQLSEDAAELLVGTTSSPQFFEYAFAVTPSGAIYPSASRALPFLRKLVVTEVPAHLDLTHIAVMAKLLTKPVSGPTIKWQDL